LSIGKIPKISISALSGRQGDPRGEKLIKVAEQELIPATPEHGKKQIRLDSGIGIKPISKTGSQRLVRRAMKHALRLPKDKQQVTLVHKGNIMKYTEGAFRDWGYELATSEFRQECVTELESWVLSNQEANPDLSIEDNARQVEPGYDALTPEKKAQVCRTVKAFSTPLGDPRQRPVEGQGDGERSHCRQHFPADPDPPR
jgi:isocitrate dehydrogenase